MKRKKKARLNKPRPQLNGWGNNKNINLMAN
jgi:hypothetical protein